MQGCCFLSDSGHRDAEEDGEDDDLEDCVGRHRVNNRHGDDVTHELLGVECGLRDTRIGACRRQFQPDANARLEQVYQNEAERKRDKARADEPKHGTQPDPTKGRCIPHMRNPGDQRAEDQRGNDHFDQPQEGESHEAQIFDKAFNRFRRCRCVDDGAHNDAEHQGNADVQRQTLGHEMSLPDFFYMFAMDAIAAPASRGWGEGEDLNAALVFCPKC